MSKRNIPALLQDILSEIDRIKKFTQGMDYQDFVKDEKTQYAVIRSLEVIGEAVKNVPESVKQVYKKIDWRKISGLRDILIHEYFGINLAILWDIVQNKVPDLLVKIEELLNKKSEDTKEVE